VVRLELSLGDWARRRVPLVPRLLLRPLTTPGLFCAQ